MSSRDPGYTARPASPPDFDPVRVRYRSDGWTASRQVAFIAALRQCRCVLEACRRVGKSRESAYRLYRRPDAAGFRNAWDDAVAVRTPCPWPVADAGAGDRELREVRQLPPVPARRPVHVHSARAFNRMVAALGRTERLAGGGFGRGAVL